MVQWTWSEFLWDVQQFKLINRPNFFMYVYSVTNLLVQLFNIILLHIQVLSVLQLKYLII